MSKFNLSKVLFWSAGIAISSALLAPKSSKKLQNKVKKNFGYLTDKAKEHGENLKKRY